MATLPDSGNSDSRSFQRIVTSFLSQPGQPFANVLSAERIARIFAKHGNLFGGTVYTTAVMVWAFLSQVLRDGKQASCQAAVARVAVYCQQQGAAGPTANTGDYCKARAKLSEAALRDLAREVGAEVEAQADPSWLWLGLHQHRHVDFRRGRRLGKSDHIIVWTKPRRPTWMDQETYYSIPETLEMREIRYSVVEPGRRTRMITVATTPSSIPRKTSPNCMAFAGTRNWISVRSISR